jgi:CheY-like chemotaxis protein
MVMKVSILQLLILILILLDIMMPIKDGIEVCKTLRVSNIITLTAKDSIEDKIIGFQSHKPSLVPSIACGNLFFISSIWHSFSSKFLLLCFKNSFVLFFYEFN